MAVLVFIIEAQISLSSKTYIISGITAATGGFGGTMTASSSIFNNDMVHTPSGLGNISLDNLVHGDATVELEIQSRH